MAGELILSRSLEPMRGGRKPWVVELTSRAAVAAGAGVPTPTELPRATAPVPRGIRVTLWSPAPAERVRLPLPVTLPVRAPLKLPLKVLAPAMVWSLERSTKVWVLEPVPPRLIGTVPRVRTGVVVLLATLMGPPDATLTLVTLPLPLAAKAAKSVAAR